MSRIQRTGGRDAIEAAAFEAEAAPAAAAEGASAKPKGAGFLPGERAPVSGQYACVDSRGNRAGKEKTIAEGEPFPPARPGLSYKLVDRTKSGGGRWSTGGDAWGAPGMKAKISGQYKFMDAEGNQSNRQTTVTKGEPFPPTPGKGFWILADMTGTKRSGEKAEFSGQYALVDKHGKIVKDSEATITKGERLPPTTRMDQAWKLVDVTAHESPEKAKGRFKPGQVAPTSGQYEVIGADGKKTGREATVVRGEPFPPTPRSGQSYRLADATGPARAGAAGRSGTEPGAPSPAWIEAAKEAAKGYWDGELQENVRLSEVPPQARAEYARYEREIRRYHPDEYEPEIIKVMVDRKPAYLVVSNTGIIEVTIFDAAGRRVAHGNDLRDDDATRDHIWD